MKKIWLAIAGIVVIASVLLVSGCNTEGTLGDVNVNLNSQTQGVWVNGEGKVTVTPDLAILSLGIESQEATVVEAQAKASEAMEKVIQALKDQGIEEKDIQTQYFNISQVTNWKMEKEEVTGYRVTNTVTVKVRDLQKVGPVIGAVVEAAGDLTRVSGLNFTVEEPAPYYIEARELAMTHAAAKAGELAEQMGIELGKVTYITENSNNYGIYYRNYMMADSAVAVPAATVPPISIGELEITATVQVAYAIK